MRLIKWSVCVLSVVVLLACSDKVETENESGFEVICDSFQDLQKHKNITQMTHLQRNDFIVEKLSKTPPEDYAKISWEAVSSASPEVRYEIFKMGAEEALGESWHCDAMESLAPTTGVVE